jgi:hypothetical protein
MHRPRRRSAQSFGPPSGRASYGWRSRTPRRSLWSSSPRQAGSGQATASRCASRLAAMDSSVGPTKPRRSSITSAILETVKANTINAIGHRITMAYAERVMMLTAIFGNDHNRPAPSEVEFRLLCWELHNAPDEGLSTCPRRTHFSRLTEIDSDSPLRRVRTNKFGCSWLKHSRLALQPCRVRAVLRPGLARRSNLEKVDLTADRMRAVANVLSAPLTSFADYRATYQDADATTLKYDAALTDCSFGR